MEVKRGTLPKRKLIKIVVFPAVCKLYSVHEIQGDQDRESSSLLQHNLRKKTPNEVFLHPQPSAWPEHAFPDSRVAVAICSPVTFSCNQKLPNIFFWLDVRVGKYGTAENSLKMWYCAPKCGRHPKHYVAIMKRLHVIKNLYIPFIFPASSKQRETVSWCKEDNWSSIQNARFPNKHP